MAEHAMRRYRREKAIPLDKIADAVGVSRGTISRIERGKQNPSMELVRRLIEKTGLSAHDFIPPEPAE